MTESIDKLAHRVHRGQAAKQLLEFQLLFDDLEADYIKEWKASAGPKKRGRLWACVKALDDIKTRLSTWKQDGERAQQDLSK